MIRSDGYPGGTEEGDGVSRRLTDEQIEQVLTGQVPPGTEAWGDVAALMAKIAASGGSDVSDEIASAHIARAAAAATEVAATAGRVPDLPPQTVVGRLRRRVAFSSVLSGIAAKLILGTSVALAATAGAAAAGILPDPIQSVAADAAAVIGIEIPDPQDPLVIIPSGRDETADTQPDDHADVVPPNPQSPTSPTTPPTTDTSPPPVDTTNSDSDSDSDSETDQQAPLGALVGDHLWTGTACDGSPVSFGYAIGADGSITATSIPAALATATATDHGLRVELGDLRVDLKLKQESEGWKLSVEAKDCSSNDEATPDNSGSSNDEATPDNSGSGNDEATPDNSGSGSGAEEPDGGDEDGHPADGDSGSSHSDEGDGGDGA